MNRRVFIWLLTTVFLLPLSPVEAQQPKRVPRIGYIVGTGQAGSRRDDEAFLRGLRDLGYIVGETILIEYRDSKGQADRIPSLVAELIQLNVDVLVAIPTAAIRAAKQATKTIPIVMVATADPIATGLVDSLARPSGNITGLTRLTRALNGKRLELLREAVPITSRVGVLMQAESTSGGIHLKEYETAARALRMQLQYLGVRRQGADFEEAFQVAAKGRVNALITVTNGFTALYRKQIADLAIKNRLPSMYESSNFVEAGGLVSYSANESESFTRAAWYVDKILKGTKPSNLPVEQPTKFELAINLRTAKQIGRAIPPQVLARADKVIK
jgi:putative tryptophan/tyrosine transport system substrate-binding protein